jgi:branched-chain amino acid transport system ATP-binding protein
VRPDRPQWGREDDTDAGGDGGAAGARQGRTRPHRPVDAAGAPPRWTTKADGVEARLEWIFSIMPEVARFRTRRALELSGGQQKMVALARALMAGTRVLLLDEPFEGLAPALARRLGEVLANLKSEGVSVLIAESNEVHVLDLLARAYFIERGSVRDKRT